jgi:hypothetical protein
MPTMSSYSKTPSLHAMPGKMTGEACREESLSKITALKLKRDHDASQAMKDHESAKQNTLAKTARLKAERLARAADETLSKTSKQSKT